MDTIGDFLTIIRNATAQKHASCRVQHSNIREGIARVLKQEGYISCFNVLKDEREFKVIQIFLKYVDGVPAITVIERCSRPGCREYFGYKKIPFTLSGLGISILSTPKGIKKCREAYREKVGGERLCRVW